LLPFETAMPGLERAPASAALLSPFRFDFLARLRENFGGRLGISARSAPARPSAFLRHGAILRTESSAMETPRNAAPVAGQGLNLGCRRVGTGSDLLDVAKEEIGAPRFLARYARKSHFRPLRRNRVHRFSGEDILEFSAPLALAACGLGRLDALRLRGAFSPIA